SGATSASSAVEPLESWLKPSASTGDATSVAATRSESDQLPAARDRANAGVMTRPVMALLDARARPASGQKLNAGRSATRTTQHRRPPPRKNARTAGAS